jgi:hypothetical protein
LLKSFAVGDESESDPENVVRMRFVKGKGKLLPSDVDTDAEELLEDQDDIEEEPEVVMVENVEEGEEGDANENVGGQRLFPQTVNAHVLSR